MGLHFVLNEWLFTNTLKELYVRKFFVKNVRRLLNFISPYCASSDGRKLYISVVYCYVQFLYLVVSGGDK